MSRKITKRDCVGCRDNFYNGNNDLGVQECWSFKDATMEKRIDIPVHQRPPYSKLTTLRPSCYKRTGYVHVKPEVLDNNGFWKR